MRTKDRIISIALPILLSALVFSVWAMCSVSRWIVSHDHVWQEMKANGDSVQWYLAEGFTQLHSLAAVPILVVFAVIILVVYYASLWRSVRIGQ